MANNKPADSDIENQKIILFDGVCNLCNRSAVFVLQNERNHDFRFASIQSETGQSLLQWCGLPPDYAQAVIYLEQGKFHSGSTAALKIGQDLKFSWSLLSSVGLLVPRFIRDWIYAQIAWNRYRWFGKRDVCMAPTNDLKARFL
jgi:predicted DCC family thiol-disulfide oxidoreductase YuxK